MSKPQIYLVETVPTNMTDLPKPSKVQDTAAILLNLTNKAQKTIDLTAMYWRLLPNPTLPDEVGFSEAELDALGGRYGRALYTALENAAQRGVQIRILQAPGFHDQPQESNQLAQRYPEQVQLRTIHMPDWYDGGIMHQKFWIFDDINLYLGSANMDWRALSQVKELGIATENQPTIAQDLTHYFETWWHFSSLEPRTVSIFDPDVQMRRPVPCWSPLADGHCIPPWSPSNSQRVGKAQTPLSFIANQKQGQFFITGCPPALCASGRTNDRDGILYTLHDAHLSICLSVMDFLPTSLYWGTYNHETERYEVDGRLAETIWWPDIFNGMLQAIGRGINVRLLISQWAHTTPLMALYLHSLQALAHTCQAQIGRRCGQLQIRWFTIPGWKSTVGDGRQYPDHTRVNHTKYIVTDRRVNVGTSNITWDYFTNTAGTSFNSDHLDLVQTLQAIFDRDWQSQYARPFVSKTVSS